jgi:KDO2-lipid IV(A) lauroyltransferase
MVPMEQVFREALKFRSDNRLVAVWFLADQRPPRTNRFWTTFLNQEASFFEGIEKMSRKLNLPIVFLDIQKTRRGYYEAWFTKLIDNTAETREYEIMLSCIRKMEEQIKAKPELWLWSHNRFKHTRPEQIKLITS